MLGSREKHVDALFFLEEPDTIVLVAPDQADDDNITFLPLIIIDTGASN